jgi:D-alanyl-D-alanine carboxypeptidase
MKKLYFLLAIAFALLTQHSRDWRTYAEKGTSAKPTIEQLSPSIHRRMHESGSLKANCPVQADDLRLVKVPYLDFDGTSKTGDLVVHRTIAQEVSAIFTELYRLRFPIDKIRLIDEYGASDDAAIADNNTSAFNCRPITGLTGQFSKHSYGIAIDINPFLNPYIRPKTEEDVVLFKRFFEASVSHGSVSDALNAFCIEHPEHCLVLPPEAANGYVTRDPRSIKSLSKSAGIILRGGVVYDVFTRHGWKWGGDWPADSSDRVRSDYQHFEKPLEELR